MIFGDELWEKGTGMLRKTGMQRKRTCTREREEIERLREMVGCENMTPVNLEKKGR